jgi:hypothetical protein
VKTGEWTASHITTAPIGITALSGALTLGRNWIRIFIAFRGTLRTLHLEARVGVADITRP